MSPEFSEVPATGPVLVFVYGTLRRGGSNHVRMAGARFIAAATVRGRLYRIEWYPGLVLDAAAGEVKGELFAVEPWQMAGLDDYEGDEYRRVRTTVATADGAPLTAWVWEWLGPVDEAQRIAGGDWVKVC